MDNHLFKKYISCELEKFKSSKIDTTPKYCTVNCEIAEKIIKMISIETNSSVEELSFQMSISKTVLYQLFTKVKWTKSNYSCFVTWVDNFLNESNF